jgi:hypothetical protein
MEKNLVDEISGFKHRAEGFPTSNWGFKEARGE